MLRTILLASLIALASTSQAHAATEKKSKAVKYPDIEKIAPYDDSWKSNFPASSSALEEKSAKLMATQEKSRKLASEMDQEFYEKKMSPAMKDFRELFLHVNTADALDNLLQKADKDYDTYPDDLKFIVAQAVPLRALRGIIWKLIPTVEDTKVFHSAILTQVKDMATNMKIFLPTDQWKAGFDYITQPYMLENGGVSVQFPKGDEVAVQAYVRNTVIPALRISAARIEKINLSGDFGVWDNKLLYGTGSFPSAIDRYALFGEVERHIALEHTYAGLSELCYQSAYSMQGSLKMNQQIARLYGWDSVLTKVDGVPSYKRVQVIRSYPSWGVLYGDGAKWTSEAWDHLTRAVDHGDQMWEAMKSRPVSEIFVADNSAALPFQRPISLRFENLKKLMQGETQIRSFVTDEVAVVNIRNFYLSPPKDLKVLYAIGFDKGLEMLPYKTTKVQYRNYFQGRGIAWNIPAYQPYFPKIQSNDDLTKVARILSQGWGGFAVAVPLSKYLD